MNNDNTLYFMHLTNEQFKAIGTKNDNVLYFVLVDNKYKLYKGNQEIIFNNDTIAEKLEEILQGAEKDYDTFKELSEALKGNKELISNLNSLINDKVDNNKLKTDLATKQDKLISGENIKTINGQEILGKGDLKVREYPEVKPHINDFLTKDKEIKKDFNNIQMDKWFPAFQLEQNKDNTNDSILNGYTPIHLGAFAEYITSTINSNNFDVSNKQDVLKDKINIKTINEKSILGPGDMYIREFPTEYPDTITAMASNFLRGNFSFTPMDVKIHPPFLLPMFYYDFRDQSNLASLSLDDLEKLMRKYTLTPFIKEQEAIIDTPEVPAEILVCNEPGKVIIPYESLQSFPSCFNFVLDVIAIENNTPVKMVSITLDFNSLSATSNGRTFLNYKGKRYTLEIKTEISKINPRYYQVQHIELRLTHSEDNSPCDISKSKLRAEVTKWWGD